MIKPFTVYNTETGHIIRHGYISEDAIPLQAGPGESVIAESSIPGQDRVVDGKVVPLPAKPGDYYKFDYSAETWIPDEARAADEVRLKRTRLLQESDWTQGKDIPLEVSQLWAPYRQALRDVTDQPGFPMDVTFPEPPV